MAYEVSQCSDKYYVQKYLDNVFWPFSTKILFAPLVDLVPLSCFKRKHHRKAYMITCGLGIIIMLLALAMNWPRIIHADGSCPNAELLFAHLIFIVLLAAISDVALDGLALLLLQGKNIGYYSTVSNLGYKFGLAGSGPAVVFLEQQIGFQSCLVAMAIFIFCSLFLVCTVTEKQTVGNDKSVTVLEAYKQLYRVVSNRNTFFLAICVFMSYRFWWQAFSSDVDLTNLGYSKNDVVVVSLIELIPTIVSSILVTQFLSGRVNPIKKLKICYPFYWLSFVIFFSTLVIPPYVNGTTSPGSKEPWVFPFRTVTNVVIIPLRATVPLLVFAHGSRVTPSSYPAYLWDF